MIIFLKTKIALKVGCCFYVIQTINITKIRSEIVELFIFSYTGALLSSYIAVTTGN